MDSSNFDHLAKQLAATTTRREALRLLGGTLAAGALAALLPGRAWAAGAGGCAAFCNAVFGRDTMATTQCIQDAKRGQGLCYTCGPAGAGGGVAPSSICCASNGGGYCASYSSATCCGSDATCLGGSCCSTTQACNGVCCPSGQVCQNGQCVTPCESLQQPCASASQCCDTGQGKTTCEYNFGSPGAPVCCNTTGGSCSTDFDCCGLTACISGTCQCIPLGGGCFYNSDCCSGTCNEFSNLCTLS